MPPLEYPTWDDPRLHFDMPGLRFDSPLPSYITDPPIIPKGTKPMLTKAQAKLISVCEKIADGLHTLIGVVTMAHNTEAAIRADIAAITDASDDVDTADTASGDATQHFKTCLEAAYQFLVNAARILRVSLGNKPSALWVEAGWSATSLETPANADLVLPHLAKVKWFLTNHPERALTTPEFQLTAAQAAALHKSLSDAMTGDSTPEPPVIPNRVKGVAWHEADLETMKQTLILTEQALKRRLHNFKNEFADVVKDPMSPHWLTVGLRRPGDTQPPAQVANVRVTALGNGLIHVEHDPVPDADHYVYRAKLVGVEERFRYLGSNGQPEYIAKKQPVGGTVQIQVVAVNEEGQQGPPSEAAQVVVA